VVTLGRPERPFSVRDDGRVAIYSFLNRRQQQETMNRAAVVVTRSGYTTLMELAELGKKALVIPTPGQSEQEYLAQYHEARGHLHGALQSNLNLAHDVPVALSYRGLPPVRPTEESIQRLLNIVVGPTEKAGVAEHWENGRETAVE
jgi:hypothetical protein